jgi:hypothetical protein
VTSQLYPKGKAHLLGQATQVNLLTDTLKAILNHSATDAYSGANEFVSDLTAGGIVARSGALASVAVTSGTVTANNVTITAVSGSSIDSIILYKDTGSDASSPLLAWWDVTAITPNGGDIIVAWNASGLFAI